MSGGPAEAPAPGDLEEGRLLFAQACEFVAGAADPAGLPSAGLPEVAFAGRSNVGKSSLLNALTGRKTLARVSNAPGRTRQINFFRLGHRLMLVDLPGYGYAKAPKSLVRSWTELVRLYLRGRTSLRRVCLLVDARHGPRASDLEAMTLLDETALVYQLVLTKADVATPGALDQSLAACRAAARIHPAAHPHVVATSARTGLGIAELRAALAELAQSR
ncbi:MAG: YihA family ribosome biogenesis GTP-binding protein [Proteobacteria bacterium]|nr:YihA family ribosome biogenesis GTP-binding protein [Pseudomonadota bacterium]